MKTPTIKIEMELEFVDNLIDWDIKEEVEWLLVDVLPVSLVAIFSGEIGDHITEYKHIKYKLIKAKEQP